MVKKYRSKRDKAAAVKGWAAQEGWSVREAKRVMDVELFLKGWAKWEKDSPYHLAMMYEMFRHAALMRGRKRLSKQSALRLPGGPSQAGPRGRLICHPACQPGNHQGRNPLPLPRSLQTAEVARIPTRGT